jgi:hypothetical protein
MKKLILFFEVAFLGVTLTVGAFAGPNVEGRVYFDISTSEPANCATVYLYDNDQCSGQPLQQTETNCCGDYVFGVEPYTTYYVKADFPGGCAKCNVSGTCSFTISDCILADIIDSTDVTVNIDLGLTACYNTSCP